jgi:dimethylhistidine N-methyltransferase
LKTDAQRARAVATFKGFAQDVAEGLCASQKFISPQYLYDAVGSALFEVITLLPEYGLTRAEERLLRSFSGEIADSVAPVEVVAELGSGSGRKTQQLLTALLKHQRDVLYVAIDVSATSLQVCCEHLENVPGVKARGIQASYLEGLARMRSERPLKGRLLLLFLGSTIGNLTDDEMVSFLKEIRSNLRVGDAFLLGADLVKPAEVLVDAYDDPAGITAAFNLNLLARINRELDADFNLRKFRHEARWVPKKSRMEMHLVSLERQSVSVRGANCEISFEAGESIWTESSRKFTTMELERAASQSRFSIARQWIDKEWPFAETLWIAK